MTTDKADLVGATLMVCVFCLAIAGVVFFCGYQSGEEAGIEQMRLEAVSHGYGELVPRKPGKKPAWRWIEPDGE